LRLRENAGGYPPRTPDQRECFPLETPHKSAQVSPVINQTFDSWALYKLAVYFPTIFPEKRLERGMCCHKAPFSPHFPIFVHRLSISNSCLSPIIISSDRNRFNIDTLQFFPNSKIPESPERRSSRLRLSSFILSSGTTRAGCNRNKSIPCPAAACGFLHCLQDKISPAAAGRRSQRQEKRYSAPWSWDVEL